MFASTSVSVNGMTAHATSAGASVSMGAMMNKNLLALVGTMISLSSSFKTSAIGCNQPRGPTRLGPTRICM